MPGGLSSQPEDGCQFIIPTELWLSSSQQNYYHPNLKMAVSLSSQPELCQEVYHPNLKMAVSLSSQHELCQEVYHPNLKMAVSLSSQHELCQEVYHPNLKMDCQFIIPT